MTLVELYRIYFLEGGAYRRASWPDGTFWHLNAHPNSFNASGKINQMHDPKIQTGTWIGMYYTGTHWIQRFIKPIDAEATDWTHVTQETVNNVTQAH